MDSTAFWSWAVSSGAIAGDPAYYSTGLAEDSEIEHAIRTAFANTSPGSEERKALVDNLWGFDEFQGDPSYWYSLPSDYDQPDLNSLGKAAIKQFGSTSEAQQGVETTNSAGVDESPSTDGVGGSAPNTVSILTSQQMRWYFDPQTGKWMVSYKLPNSNRNVFFEATGAQLDAVFGDGQRPANFESVNFSDLAQREGYTFGGDIAEVEGTGSFEGEMDAVIARALDEGKLPKWAQDDPAVMDIIYIAQSEGKTTEWTVEQISKLPSFKQRFPGIETMTKGLDMNIVDAVTGFLEMEQGIKQLVIRDGGNPESVTPQEIGDMLAKGHSLTDATFVYDTFDKLEKNAGALSAFNEILAARGQNPLDADGQFEFMAGNAPAELYDIWEEASLHRAAIDAGIGSLGVSGAVSLAARTEGLTSYGAAYEGLTEAASKMLQFRKEIDYGRYNIDEQDLIDASLGLAPSSGITQADLARNLQRAFQSAKAERERLRSQPFTGFTADGKPRQQSLGGLSRETA